MSDLGRFSDIPQRWKWATLGEVTTVIRGASPRPKGDPRYFGGQIPWIMISDVSREPGKYLTKTREGVTRAGADKSRELPPGSLILSNSGTVCIPKILRVQGCIHDGFVTFPTLDPAIETDFLYYWFHFIRPRVIQENKQGITQVNLNTEIVRALPIPIVPQEEQCRIVAKIEELFSDLDSGVAALERVRANLKCYRAAVLRAAVEGRLTEEWRERNPATEPAAKLLERILAERRAKWEQDQLRKFREAGRTPPKGWKERYKSPVGHEETSLPELPASWSWTSLSVVAWQVRDGPHHSPKYSPKGIPFITGGHVRPDEIDFPRAKCISPELHKEFSRRCEPAVGDLLYTKGGTTGIAHIVRDERAFSVWVHVAVLKLADSINRRYLQHMLNSPMCYRQAQKYTHGVGNQDLGLTRMVKIAISLPPLAEQAEIVAEVDRRLSVADAAETQVENALQRAARLRQAILKRAFEGKLVPQDPTDEPAAALLERIKSNGVRENVVTQGERRRRNLHVASSKRPTSARRLKSIGTPAEIDT